MKAIDNEKGTILEKNKKVYSRPQLELYVNIAQVTRTVGATGHTDNPNPNHTAVKTRL